jgi:hypothetical protein
MTTDQELRAAAAPLVERLTELLERSAGWGLRPDAAVPVTRREAAVLAEAARRFVAAGPAAPTHRD